MLLVYSGKNGGFSITISKFPKEVWHFVAGWGPLYHEPSRHSRMSLKGSLLPRTFWKPLNDKTKRFTSIESSQNMLKKREGGIVLLMVQICCAPVDMVNIP